jgi:hypothetical protein
MKKAIFQIIILVFLLFCCAGGYFIIKAFLDRPFRSTNDSLHQQDSSVTLDFLIPEGTYIDEKMTIGEVVALRYRKEESIYSRVLNAALQIVPAKYRYWAGLALFLFWSFLFMTFLRIFTFIRYGRALRVSLLFGGITYFFMPDFSIGRIDDGIFLGIPVIIIIAVMWFRKRKKKRERSPA